MSRRRPSIPQHALSDRRLSARDIRVLAALSLFEARRGAVLLPDRSLLAEITGTHETNISHSLTKLVASGYLAQSTNGRVRSYVINWEEDPCKAQHTVSDSTLSQCQIQHRTPVLVLDLTPCIRPRVSDPTLSKIRPL